MTGKEIFLFKNFECTLNSLILERSGFNRSALDTIHFFEQPFMLAKVMFKDLNVGCMNERIKQTKIYKRVLKIVADFQKQNGEERFVGIWISKSRTHAGMQNSSAPEYNFYIDVSGKFIRSCFNMASCLNVNMVGSTEKKINDLWRKWNFMNMSNIDKNKKIEFSEYNPDAFALCNLHTSKNRKDITAILNWNKNVRLKLNLSIDLELKDKYLSGSLYLMKLCPESILQALFENQATKDATIITEDGVEMKCHKGILAAQSPVFERMLTSKMQEGKSGTIDLSYVSTEGITHLVNYLYGKPIPFKEISSEIALELLQAANEYELLHLDSDAVSLFLNKEDIWFSADTALQLHFFAKNVEEYAELNKHVLKIMARMPSAQLRTSQKFKELKPNEALDLTLKLMDELNYLRMSL